MIKKFVEHNLGSWAFGQRETLDSSVWKEFGESCLKGTLLGQRGSLNDSVKKSKQFRQKNLSELFQTIRNDARSKKSNDKKMLKMLFKKWLLNYRLYAQIAVWYW